jgi:hypothetical protein
VVRGRSVRIYLAVAVSVCIFTRRAAVAVVVSLQHKTLIADFYLVDRGRAMAFIRPQENYHVLLFLEGSSSSVFYMRKRSSPYTSVR